MNIIYPTQFEFSRSVFGNIVLTPQINLQIILLNAGERAVCLLLVLIPIEISIFSRFSLSDRKVAK